MSATLGQRVWDCTSLMGDAAALFTYIMMNLLRRNVVHVLV